MKSQVFKSAIKISVKTCGESKGKFVVKDERNGKVVAEISLAPALEWTSFSAALNIESGKKPLYFTYVGEGYADFMDFTLE